MGRIADRLDAMTIKANSPDGTIRSTLVGRSQLSLEFTSGGYERRDERELEHQLAKLATLTWTAYFRGYTEVVTSEGMTVMAAPEDEWNSHDRRYQEELREVEGRGESKNGHVKARTLALLRWQVRIKDGAVRKLSEPEFVNEALTAAGRAIKDYRVKSTQLRKEFFGPGLAVVP